MPSLIRFARFCPPALLVGPLLLAGCGKDKDAETGGYQQGQVQYGQQTYPGGGQGGMVGVGGAPATAPPGYGQPTTPTPLPVAGASAGGAPATAPPVTPGAAAGGRAQIVDPAAATIVQPLLNELAKAHIVAGMKPVGSLLVGSFQTGQSLEGQVQLQPQKCYTIVATALAPVTELNVQLLATTLLPNVNPVLAADSDTGATAVIGKKPNCYRWPFPLPAPAKVVAQVVGGAGLAAVQVYEK